MLPQNEREQREFERMPAALDEAERIPADIRILRRESDESLFGQAHGVAMVVRRIDFGIGDFARPSFQTVLADHDRAALAGL